MENEITKEIEYEPIPAVARMENDIPVRISGARYNQIQDELLKVAFLEKVAASKYTVFEKVNSSFTDRGFPKYSYVCYGPDQLAQQLVDAKNLLEKSKDVEKELNDAVSNLKKSNDYLREDHDRLQREAERIISEFDKYKKRGFWARLFNQTV